MQNGTRPFLRRAKRRSRARRLRVDAQIEVAEGLSVRLGTDLLFVHLRYGRADNPSLKAGVNLYIADLMEHINGTLQPRLAALGLPPIRFDDEDGIDKITTRMFRRTVAWHIATQPFGVVAGMIQYGQMCETMFEG
jgi:hypothetical protein